MSAVATTAETIAISTADVVRHTPSGEEWLVLYVDNGHLYPAGWPPGRVPLADCELIIQARPDAVLSLAREMIANGQYREQGIQALRNLGRRLKLGKSIYINQSVRGAIRRLQDSRRKSSGFQHPDGREMTRWEALDALLDEIALGREHLPIHKDCKPECPMRHLGCHGFAYTGEHAGCPGYYPELEAAAAKASQEPANG